MRILVIGGTRSMGRIAVQRLLDRGDVDWYRTQYQGADAEGYAHRDREWALAERWRTAFDRFVAEF